MTLKTRYKKVLDYFIENVGYQESELNYSNPFELIVAVILSAQCTDKRVNIVTPNLFQSYPTPKTLSEASFEEVFNIIRSISYPNNKAKHLIAMASKLENDFGGIVPCEVEKLMTLPGVGRKTANVVSSIIYGTAVIAVDTHIFRVSRRIGLSKGTTPRAVELDLEKYIPKEYRANAHHWLLLHGRYICSARNSKCENCPIATFCAYFSSLDEVE